MIIEGYGIVLKRLSIDDIELVRNWRNSALIHQFMEHKEHITPEQQKNWFQSINNEFNNYFVIEVNAVKVGLIYGAKIDWDLKETGNAGIFIWDQSYWETKIPLLASILLTDTSLLLNLKKSYIKILKSNTAAKNYNKILGYVIEPNQENVLNQKYVLKQSSYQITRKNLEKTIFKNELSGTVTLRFAESDNLDLFYYEIIQNVTKSKNSFYKFILE